MIYFLYLAILGLIQGVTEWLPISSEAQTMVFMINFMQISPKEALSYAIFLHLGTLCAVLLRFQDKYREILNNLSFEYPLTRILVIATIGSAITAVPLYLILKYYILELPLVNVNILIGVLLIITGVLLKIARQTGGKQLVDIQDRDSILLGLLQGLAILPGISRSGITLVTLLGRKVNQELALQISFLISAPVVLGAILLDIQDISHIPLVNAGIVTLFAFIAGFLTISVLLKFAQKVSMWMFALALGILTIVLSFVFI